MAFTLGLSRLCADFRGVYRGFDVPGGSPVFMAGPPRKRRWPLGGGQDGTLGDDTPEDDAPGDQLPEDDVPPSDVEIPAPRSERPPNPPAQELPPRKTPGGHTIL